MTTRGDEIRAAYWNANVMPMSEATQLHELHVSKNNEFAKAMDAELRATKATLKQEIEGQLFAPPTLTLAAADQIIRELYEPLVKQELQRVEDMDAFSYGRIHISGRTMAHVKKVNREAGFNVNTNRAEQSMSSKGDFWVAYKGDKMRIFAVDHQALMFIAQRTGWKLRAGSWGKAL